MTLVAIFIALVFLLSLVSGRLERTIVTAPIVFTGAGMVAFLCLPGLRDRQTNLELLLQIAEVGLVLLLFTDASRTDLISALPGMDIYARKTSILSPAAAELEGAPAESRDLTANPAHHPCV